MAVDLDGHYANYVAGVGKHDYQLINEEGAEDYDNGTNAIYAVVFDDDRMWRVDYHVCYGRLNELEQYAERAGYYGKPVSVLVQLQVPLMELEDFDVDMQRVYYDWLLNHSPFSSVFVTKNVTKALKDKVLVLDVNSDANLLVSACSAVRLPWEYYFADYKIPSIARLWYALVTEGVEGNLAMALANNFSGDRYNNYTYRGSTAGHQFLSVDSKTTIMNFTRGLHKKTEPFNEQLGTDDHIGLAGLWSKYSDKSARIGDLRDFLTSRIDGTYGQKINPFAVKATSASYKLADVVKGLAIAAKDIQTILET